MTTRMRNTLTLAAMVFAAAALPFYPVITVYWLVIAFWLAASSQGLTSVSFRPRNFRALRRLRRRGDDRPRTT